MYLFISVTCYCLSLNESLLFQILKFNTPVVAAMQASSIFYEELPWFDQLSALLGHHDAKKFQKILFEYVGQVEAKCN